MPVSCCLSPLIRCVLPADHTCSPPQIRQLHFYLQIARKARSSLRHSSALVQADHLSWRGRTSIVERPKLLFHPAPYRPVARSECPVVSHWPLRPALTLWSPGTAPAVRSQDMWDPGGI